MAALLLSGCAAPIVAGLSLSTISTIASVVSTAITGKDWSDHALSWVTGKNCNVTEGILRKNRKICEERGSLAAAEDFQGIFVAFGGKDADPLQRFARARAEELAAAPASESAPESAPVIASAPAKIIPAQAVSIDIVAPLKAIFDGVPRTGASGYAKVNGKVVYLMTPIYDNADSAPVPRPRPVQPLQSAGL